MIQTRPASPGPDYSAGWFQPIDLQPTATAAPKDYCYNIKMQRAVGVTKHHRARLHRDRDGRTMRRAPTDAVSRGPTSDSLCSQDPTAQWVTGRHCGTRTIERRVPAACRRVRTTIVAAEPDGSCRAGHQSGRVSSRPTSIGQRSSNIIGFFIEGMCKDVTLDRAACDDQQGRRRTHRDGARVLRRRQRRATRRRASFISRSSCFGRREEHHVASQHHPRRRHRPPARRAAAGAKRPHQERWRWRTCWRWRSPRPPARRRDPRPARQRQRCRRRWPRSSASIPTTGVVIVAARMDPVLMLEAMRAGVNEWVADPLTAAELNAAIERVGATRPVAVSQRQDRSRSSAPRAASARRRLR